MCFFLLTGCWSAVELNDRAFISVIILDLDDDENIEVTLGMPLTDNMIAGMSSSAPEDNQSFGYFSRKGKTIEEALQKIQGDISRSITFGQNRNIIIGKKYAEHGIDRMLELAARNPFIRLNTSLFYVDGNAKEAVTNSPAITERFFVSILNNYIKNHYILNTTIRDMMISRTSGGDGLLPILSFKPNVGSPTTDLPPTVSTGGGAIIREGKLVRPYLSPDQITSAKAITKQMTQFFFSVKSPTDENSIGFYSTFIKLETKVSKQEDGIHILLRPISNVVTISSDSDLNLMDQKRIYELEKTIEMYSNNQLKDAIKVLQQSKADVFHFDRYLHVKYPKEWKQISQDWRTYYSENLKVDVESKIYLKRKGSTKMSFKEIFLNGKDD